MLLIKIKGPLFGRVKPEISKVRILRRPKGNYAILIIFLRVKLKNVEYILTPFPAIVMPSDSFT